MTTRKTVVASDGVEIVYSAAGAGETTLVFIHGGLADRTFFDRQLDAFSDRYRVLAIDLAGHGESSKHRDPWTIQRAGEDVAGVVRMEKVRRAILFGNSLGGPVAIEAALLLPERAAGVVGIDTFQDVGHTDSPEYAQQLEQHIRRQTEAFNRDYAGSVHAMVTSLFHKDADPALMRDAEQRMQRTPRDAVVRMFAGMAGYNTGRVARRLTVPLRAINGDLFPTDIERIRSVKPDFDAIVMEHMGHYPMLERPAEFNAHAATVAGELVR
jgi:pimeloyl-ACP methyl ester carboxylesterase